MKHFIYFLLLLIASKSYGQEINLQGTYSASFIGGESIKFVGEDSFYFNGFYCTYGVYGRGRCEIRNNNLYLFFEKIKDIPKIDVLKSPIIEKFETADTNLTIQITVLNNLNVPISYASILVRTIEGVEVGSAADSLGQATFRIQSKEFPIIVITSALGIEGKQISLENKSNYIIKLFHHENDLFHKELNMGEVYVYEIEEISEDLILMRPGKSVGSFRKYRRIDE